MKRFRFLLVATIAGLAVASAAGPARADGYGTPGCSTCGGSSHGLGRGLFGGFGGRAVPPPSTLFNGGAGGNLLHKPKLPVFQAAPWYQYWPYDAHFQTPAPVSGPFYGPPLTGNFPVNPYFPGPAGTYGYGANSGFGYGQGIPGGPPPGR